MWGRTGERRTPRAVLAWTTVLAVVAGSVTACAPEGAARAPAAVSRGEASPLPPALSADTSGSPSPGDRNDTDLTIESGSALVGLWLHVPPPTADGQEPSPSSPEAPRPGFAARVERPPQQA